ncbi:MAG: adenylate/guanylate cyclase domain-containing protein, partial [Mycobacterium sp.]
MTACAACGTELRAAARFCDGCGAATASSRQPAEYKQVTVLFADVVASMEIASSVGAERLREIMTELFNRCGAVVRLYGGTVDKFTGDGIMAMFGAPVALEDHAFRACLAALEIQTEAQGPAGEVQRSDGIELRLRVGLNSGQVIAGELGSNPLSYTAIGEQVGMAQRMESVAPAGGLMLSESTARLVEDRVALAEPQLVHIKGAAEPVRARQLLAVSSDHRRSGRRDPSLVGRTWEMGALAGMLDAAIDGTGCVVGVVGPPGIGKRRL